jgi:hypothetical protein
MTFELFDSALPVTAMRALVRVLRAKPVVGVSRPRDVISVLYISELFVLVLQHELIQKFCCGRDGDGTIGCCGKDRDVLADEDV